MGQKQSKREALRPKQPELRITNGSIESRTHLNSLIGPDSSRLKTTQTFKSSDFQGFVHKHQPMLCDACINLAMIFSYPAYTRRGWSAKASDSDIAHHLNLVSLFESSRTCPLCSLIIVAVPGLTEWLWRDIVADIFRAGWLKFCQSPGPSADSSDDKWTKYVDNIECRLNAGQFSDWEDKYVGQVLHLGFHGVAPALGEVIRKMTMSGHLKTKKFNKIYCSTQQLEIRECYTIKGQISELALSLRHNTGALGLQDLPVKHLRVSSHSNKFTARLVSGRPVSPQNSSLETLELGKSWIEFCFDNHSRCRWSSQSEDPCLPTRVIDVVTQHNDSVMLISSQGMCGKWAALSHCWGIKPFLTLREDTIQLLKTGIPIASLPKTFQDAIKLTRFLGLKYLWIDSLCILQDSVADWAAEAATMPRVYQNAYITIAAAATEDIHGGIFVEKAWARVSMPCVIPVENQNDEGTVTIDLPLDHGLEHEKINCLNKRAWCFQEARLSRRLLTFDRLQMSYTCLIHGLLESRDRPEGAAREEKNPFLPKLYSAAEKDEQTKNQELLGNWYQAIADYTSRSLTFQDDKLVAIAGIARIAGDFMNDEYSAGLFHRSLPQGLLWSPYEEETFPNPPHKSSLPSSYRAPSWSWASIESPISHFLCRQIHGGKVHAQILEIKTTLRGLDPYGQVKAGFLKIRAPLQEVMCGEASSRWPYQPNLLPLDYSSTSEPFVFEEELKLGHAIFDLHWMEKGSRIFLLQITDAYGLILVPKTVYDREVYSRIGICHFASNVKLEDVASIEIV